MNRGRLRVATYNVHSFVGADGQEDPERVVDVIRELGAEVVALQEVATGSGALRELEHLGDWLDMEVIPGPTLRSEQATYGNAVLSRLPVLERRELDLAVAGAEARAALVLRLEWQDRRVRLVATHFGLRVRERRRQATLLADHLLRSTASTDEFTLLLGDFNDWSRSGRQLTALRPVLSTLTRIATFPARRPWLPLDRIGVGPPATLENVAVHATPVSRLASDHLPLTADVILAPEDRSTTPVLRR